MQSDFEFYMDGDDVVVPAVAEIDITTADEMLRIARMALDLRPGAKRLVIDLSRTSFVDSSGLATIVKVRNAALTRGVPLLLRDLSPQLRRLLEITGLLPELDTTSS